MYVKDVFLCVEAFCEKHKYDTELRDQSRGVRSAWGNYNMGSEEHLKEHRRRWNRIKR